MRCSFVLSPSWPLSSSQQLFHSSDKNSTPPARRRSPYEVLELSSRNGGEITREDIKSSFRRLAKLHHPDLQQQQSSTDRSPSNTTFHELLHAYEQLMISNDVSSLSTHQQRMNFKVELACETYTIKELQMDSVHDVHSLLILYDDDTNDEQNGTTKNNDKEASSQFDDSSSKNEDNQKQQLSRNIVHPIKTHPDDSISDLKRIILSKYSLLWGLDGRDVDRDGIAMGWELVVPSDHPLGNGEKETGEDDENEILGNHWFLHTYDVHHGDTVYAVVRKKEFW